MRLYFILTIITIGLVSCNSEPNTVITLNHVEPNKTLLDTYTGNQLMNGKMFRGMGYSFKKKLVNVSSSSANDRFVGIRPSTNVFYYSLGLAFSEHYPYELSPDVIWSLILSGVNNHIKVNKEKYQDYFKIDSNKINQNIFTEINDSTAFWNRVISSYYDESINKNQKLKILESTFSTTAEVERIANKVNILSINSNYVKYSLTTLCGIPQVTLTGDKEDWLRLRESYNLLVNEFNLEWWSVELLPVLDEFVNVFDGNINKEFWKGIYKYHNAMESGAIDGLNGWVTKFMPYINDRKRVDWNAIIRLDEIPSSSFKFEFTWNNQGQEKDLVIISGIMGVKQDSLSMTLKPKMGWGVYKIIDHPIFGNLKDN